MWDLCTQHATEKKWSIRTSWGSGDAMFDRVCLQWLVTSTRYLWTKATAHCEHKLNLFPCVYRVLLQRDWFVRRPHVWMRIHKTCTLQNKEGNIYHLECHHFVWETRGTCLWCVGDTWETSMTSCTTIFSVYYFYRKYTKTCCKTIEFDRKPVWRVTICGESWSTETVLDKHIFKELILFG